jgi:hypothetical protein
MRHTLSRLALACLTTAAAFAAAEPTAQLAHLRLPPVLPPVEDRTAEAIAELSPSAPVLASALKQWKVECNVNKNLHWWYPKVEKLTEEQFGADWKRRAEAVEALVIANYAAWAQLELWRIPRYPTQFDLDVEIFKVQQLPEWKLDPAEMPPVFLNEDTLVPSNVRNPRLKAEVTRLNAMQDAMYQQPHGGATARYVSKQLCQDFIWWLKYHKEQWKDRSGSLLSRLEQIGCAPPTLVEAEPAPYHPKVGQRPSMSSPQMIVLSLLGAIVAGGLLLVIWQRRKAAY